MEIPMNQEDITEVAPTQKVTLKRVRRPKFRRSWYVAAAGFTFIAGAGILPRVRQGQVLAGQVQALQESVPIVSVADVTVSPESAAAALPANIQAIEQTTIQARTSGYLSQRFVDIGSHVSKGQVLAIVESPEVDQQVSQSEADVARARAGMGQAAADSDRARAAISAAQSEVSKSQAAVLQASADLVHFRAKMTQAQAAARAAAAKVVAADQHLEGAKADLNRALVAQSLARKTRDRWRELERANAVSGQEVDEKETDYSSSVASVEGATAAVSSAEADADAARASLQSARADVDAAKADVDSGRQRLVAARSVVNAGEADIEAARSGLAASRSNVDAARAVVRANQANLRRTSALKSFEKIVAPFDGVITARNVDVGDLISPSSGGQGNSGPSNAVSRTGLFGLARTDALCVMVNVPENEMAMARTGADAQITVQELPGKTFMGTVFHVSGALDADSRTLLVEVRLPNKDGALKPGMYGQVSFLGVTKRRTLRIPANSLVFDSRGTRVATVSEAGTLHFVPVKIALDLGDQLEVTGLTGHETVVTNPDDSLTEGMRVNLHRDGGKP
jgi:RND family efflux transporter MFP subunit